MTIMILTNISWTWTQQYKGNVKTCTEIRLSQPSITPHFFGVKKKSINWKQEFCASISYMKHSE